jgi:phage tail protein X
MKTYNARQGDMWDNLAYRLYSEEGLMNTLLYANPKLTGIVVFERTTVVNVPDRPVVVETNLNLPPWKR